MLTFVILLLVATTATNIEEVHDFNETLIEEEEYEELKYNSTTEASLFDSGVMNSALNVIEDILLFKEVQECRPNYPFMDTPTFYKRLYCYFIEGESTTGGGAFCKLTEDLIEKIKNRLLGFVAFGQLFNATIDCQEESRFERSDELVGGLEPERMKAPELNHIYLGPSKYPIETVMIRKSVRPITLTSSRTTYDISEYLKTTTNQSHSEEDDESSLTTMGMPMTTPEVFFFTPKPTLYPDNPTITSNDLPLNTIN